MESVMEDKFKFADEASKELAAYAEQEQIEIVWHRYEKMSPKCKFGQLGICCRICNMGPCRLNPKGIKNTVGVCGADIDTIVARNLVRMIASGAAAHSDHGREIVHSLLLAAKNLLIPSKRGRNFSRGVKNNSSGRGLFILIYPSFRNFA